MGYDPNEPRDKNGKWTTNASGHNAGGGNRDLAKNIADQHKFEEALREQRIHERQFRSAVRFGNHIRTGYTHGEIHAKLPEQVRQSGNFENGFMHKGKFYSNENDEFEEYLIKNRINVISD